MESIPDRLIVRIKRPVMLKSIEHLKTLPKSKLVEALISELEYNQLLEGMAIENADVINTLLDTIITK